MVKLSATAQGFVDRCLERGLSPYAMAEKAAKIAPALAADLQPLLQKSAMIPFGQGFKAVGEKLLPMGRAIAKPFMEGSALRSLPSKVPEGVANASKAVGKQLLHTGGLTGLGYGVGSAIDYSNQAGGNFPQQNWANQLAEFGALGSVFTGPVGRQGWKSTVKALGDRSPMAARLFEGSVGGGAKGYFGGLGADMAAQNMGMEDPELRNIFGTAGVLHGLARPGLERVVPGLSNLEMPKWAPHVATGAEMGAFGAGSFMDQLRRDAANQQAPSAASDVPPAPASAQPAPEAAPNAGGGGLFQGLMDKATGSALSNPQMLSEMVKNMPPETRQQMIDSIMQDPELRASIVKPMMDSMVPKEFQGLLNDPKAMAAAQKSMTQFAEKLSNPVYGPMMASFMGLSAEDQAALQSAFADPQQAPQAAQAAATAIGTNAAKTPDKVTAQGTAGPNMVSQFLTLLGLENDNPITQFFAGLDNFQAGMVTLGMGAGLFGLISLLMGSGTGAALGIGGGLLLGAGGMYGPQMMNWAGAGQNQQPQNYQQRPLAPYSL